MPTRAMDGRTRSSSAGGSSTLPRSCEGLCSLGGASERAREVLGEELEEQRVRDATPQEGAVIAPRLRFFDRHPLLGREGAADCPFEAPDVELALPCEQSCKRAGDAEIVIDGLLHLFWLGLTTQLDHLERVELGVLGLLH